MNLILVITRGKLLLVSKLHGDNKISSAADMAEAFNHHFAKIGHDLASEIPLVNTQPESLKLSHLC